MLIVRVTLFRFHQVKLAHKSVSAQKKSKVRKRQVKELFTGK